MAVLPDHLPAELVDFFSDLLGVQGKIRGHCSSCDPGAGDSDSGSSRLPSQSQEEIQIGNDDPIAEARARGWRVEVRPSGLLIDTQGQPAERGLMDRLHELMLDQGAA